MEKSIYQIQIALKNFKPKIWRRILVNSNMLLSDFHKVIQTTMGWDNSHLHQFIKDRTYYSKKIKGDDFWDMSGDNVDYKKMKISDLLVAEKDKMVYEYDFGDGWEHSIILEKILPFEKGFKHPVCLAGKMSCPHEDVGGVWGYAEMLEILKDPKHEEYENYMEWLGGGFDSEEFDIEMVNEMLQDEDYGCLCFF
jgi:hypothetical protein